ncbi:hypothetical protein D3C80_1621290 [compost metagenome]
MSRSMPMAAMTSALRRLPSAYCWAAIALRLACISTGLVRRSLSQVTATCSRANTRADQPSTGLMRNSSTIITRAIGASIKASSAGENRKSRTTRKSFKGWALPPGMRWVRAAKMALNTHSPICASNRTLAPRMISLRAHSSTSISA